MSNRFFVWTLAGLAVVLVLVPLLGTFGVMSGGWMTGGGMMGGGMMMGMGVLGTLWMLLAIIVIAALVVLLVREANKA